MHVKPLAPALTLLTPLFLSSPLPAATVYTFTRIATISANDVTPSPTINDSGLVSFQGTPTSTNVTGVYAGSGGPLTTIDTTANPRFQTFYGTDINNAGQVAFSGGAPATGNAVGTGNGSSPASLAAGKPAHNVGGVPAINDPGAIAFVTSAGLLRRSPDGSTFTTISAPSPGGILGYGSTLSMNDAGTVAFFANFSNGTSALLASDGATTTTVATTGSAFSQLGYADINQPGQVTFTATLAASGLRVVYVRATDGTLTPVADTSGTFGAFDFASINDSGNVSFLAFYDAGGSGIYTGPHPQNDLVIRTGATLAGSTITSLWTSNHSLNDAGSISFYARFADGSAAVFRADPVPTPTALLGSSLLCLLLTTRRRPRNA